MSASAYSEPNVSSDGANSAAPDSTARPASRGSEARGFVLYVGLDEAKARADGVTLNSLVATLRKTAAEVAPSSETYAAVALAPRGAGGRDIEVVRLALGEPAALARHRQSPDEDHEDSPGVVIDLSRKRVLLDGEPSNLTYKEFELLQYLVLREGRTIERAELITALWSETDEDAPNERTIDVHVRRLRAKLGQYEQIVRTVRGAGYRFDRHADVAVRHTSTPSPDLF